MSFIVKGSNSEDQRIYEPAPEGTHQAICNMVVDLGLQELTWQGKVSIKPQCYIRWELPTERIEYTDRKSGEIVSGPMLVGRTYHVTMHEKGKLRPHLEGWRGRAFTPTEIEAGFDLFKLAGTACQVRIKHKVRNERTWADVEDVVGWPKGLKRPTTTETGVLLYSAAKPEHLPDLPQWLRDKIDRQIKDTPKEPPQTDDEGSGGTGGDNDLSDDIPF